MLCIIELDVAVRVGVGGAVEGADVDEGGCSVRSVGGEELVEETCSAVEDDGLGSEEEIRVCGFGVLVAVILVLGQDGLIVRVAVDDVGLCASVVCECGHLGEVGGVERVVIAEEEVSAC